MVKYRSSKLAQKRKKEFQLKFILILVILISFVFVISSFSKSEFSGIKKIEMTGNKNIKKSLIREIINKNLSGNYFYLFSKNNILLYPKQTIENEIRDSFPRIKNVDLNLDLPGILRINISERIPYVLWCGDSSSTECYFADGEGYIFAGLENLGDLDKVKSNKMFRYYTNLTSPIKENIFFSGGFKDVDSFVKFIEGLNLEPYKFVVNESKYEIFFGAQKSRIIFDKTKDTKDIMNNLQSVLNMDEFSDIENLKKLEYIDLRFGNKVFYK